MKERPSENNGKSGFNSLIIPKDVIRVVPAMKYMLGVPGIVTAVGIVTLWRVRYDVADNGCKQRMFSFCCSHSMFIC